MANATAVCTSFKVELLKGIHALGTSVVRPTTGADVIVAALYYATATVNGSTTAYGGVVGGSPDVGEVVGTNYSPAGVTNSTEPTSSATTAFWTPTAIHFDFFTPMTIASPFDAMLLFNNSQGNRAIAVVTFGAQTVTAGTITISMPTNSASSAMLRLT